MKIGEVVERLIRIKDKNELYHSEREAINEACNLLHYRFNNMSDTDKETHEHIYSLIVMYDDLRDALENKGFSSCPENVKMLLDSKLKGYLENVHNEITAVIEYAIDDNKDKLSRRN